MPVIQIRPPRIIETDYETYRRQQRLEQMQPSLNFKVLRAITYSLIASVVLWVSIVYLVRRFL